MGAFRGPIQILTRSLVLDLSDLKRRMGPNGDLNIAVLALLEEFGSRLWPPRGIDRPWLFEAPVDDYPYDLYWDEDKAR